MISELFRKNCAPGPELELLVRAALMEGEDSWKAWQQWRKDADLKKIRDPSIRMLPLIYRRWEERLGEDPVAPIMKGIYRRTWYRTLLLRNQSRKVVACLRNRGIPTLLLKGVALSLQYYKDPGVRSMEDADILVPPENADRAISALEDLGFQFRHIRPLPYLRNFTHAAEFYSQQLGKVDLHWYPIHEIRWHQSEAVFWQTSEAIVLGDEESRILHPTYQLFHLCCHAIRFMWQRDARWIPDTVTLIRCDGHRIDWDLLVREAERFRRVLAIRDTLGYLQEKIKNLVPPGILASLRHIPVGRKEEKIYKWQLLPYRIRGRSPVFGNISWLWNYCIMESRYETPDGQMTLWKKWRQFEKFLRLRNGFESRRQLAGMILKKAASRPWLLVR